MRRRRAVIEHVPEMAAAAAAMRFLTHHAVASVRLRFDGARHRIVETRPSGSAFELHLGNEQRLIAGHATERTGPLLSQERAASRPFGAMLAHDLVLFRRQQLAPFSVVVCNGILLGHDVQLLFWSSPAEAGDPASPGLHSTASAC